MLLQFSNHRQILPEEVIVLNRLGFQAETLVILQCFCLLEGPLFTLALD